jgi:plasmid maintenance system antidote protein VapI
MSRAQTDYEKFEESSVENRRRLREEELIFEVTEMLCEALQAEKLSKSEVASKLGKSKGFVSQLLAGGRNLTLRTLADVADALGRRVHFLLEPEFVQLSIPAGMGTSALTGVSVTAGATVVVSVPVTHNQVFNMAAPQLNVVDSTILADVLADETPNKLAA